MTVSQALDRRIVIERYAETRDTFNNVVQTWSTLATVWASKKDVKDVSNAERFRTQEVGAEVATRFGIRWSPTVSGVNAKDRIQYDGATYNITGIKEMGRREGIEITAMRRGD
jgi:SPP1 family predicted phage head-tail adaptor